MSQDGQYVALFRKGMALQLDLGIQVHHLGYQLLKEVEKPEGSTPLVHAFRTSMVLLLFNTVESQANLIGQLALMVDDEIEDAPLAKAALSVDDRECLKKERQSSVRKLGA